MYAQIQRFLAIAALAAFSFAQYQGWSLFDNEAEPDGRLNSSGSSRTYHK